MYRVQPIATDGPLVFQSRDFTTHEDELPQAVSISSEGVQDSGTYFTEVKQETTDDR